MKKSFALLTLITLVFSQSFIFGSEKIPFTGNDVPELEITKFNPEQEKIDYYNNLKPNYQPGETGHNPNTNPESNGNRAEVEVYFCTDWYPSESSFNICGADGCVWDGGYGAGWIGSSACYSEYIDLADGDYTLHLYDSYGDGGICAGLYEPGVGTYLDYTCTSGSGSDHAFTVGLSLIHI